MRLVRDWEGRGSSLTWGLSLEVQMEVDGDILGERLARVDFRCFPAAAAKLSLLAL